MSYDWKKMGTLHITLAKCYPFILNNTVGTVMLSMLKMCTSKKLDKIKLGS